VYYELLLWVWFRVFCALLCDFSYAGLVCLFMVSFYVFCVLSLVCFDFVCQHEALDWHVLTSVNTGTGVVPIR